MSQLQIVTINCRGLGNFRKRKRIFQILKSTNVDVCFLQETHVYNNKVAHTYSKDLGGRCYWSFGTSRSKGVGIWFKENLICEIVALNRDMHGRLLCVNVNINNVKMKLVNVYAPVVPKERKHFFSSLYKYLPGRDITILGGDFNCVTNVSLDKGGGNSGYGEIAGDKLITICDDFNLADVFRNKFPNKREYTWCDSSKSIFIRLDRFYISKNVVKDATSIVHAPIVENISDHGMVKLSLNFSSNGSTQIGPGFWKCNVNILKDEYFTYDFKELWECLDDTQYRDAEWWERCKLEFKRLIISHSLRLSMCRKGKLKEAHFKLQKLINDGNNSIEHHTQINTVTQEIESLCDEVIAGSKIRAKVQFLENNERPTRYFLHREKKLACSKVISKLTNDNGDTFTKNEDIVDECKGFYAKLYNYDTVDESLNDYFFNDLQPLTPDASAACEGFITSDECWEAIKSMSCLKSPGLDGLPKEFYAFAFKYIGKSFVEMLNNSWEEGILAQSQRVGLITLICKDLSQSDNLNFWRPISLLNTDYKILSKLISLRLSKVIAGIVHADQTCSIPGRSIHDNVHLIRNLIEYANDKNMSAAIISLDQSKAFDRVSHEYLFNVLSHFGFGPQFISLVKLLYNDISSSVLVNGFISDKFPVLRSVRQGCSLSPLLYVLCMEPFANRIRMNPTINGIPLPGTSIPCKISQYADDTNLFISDTESVRKILILVELYELVSGAILNKSKTFGMWLGRWRGRSDQPCNLKWSSDCKKFYGVYFGTNEGVNKNWKLIIDKFKRCVDMYTSRALSFRGKSLILNTMCCSTIWYVGSFLLMPEIVLRKINKLLFTFLWNKKPEAVKRDILYNNFSEGGFQVINISVKIDSLRVKHILNIIKGTDAKWGFLAKYWVGIHLRKYAPALAALDCPHSERMPPFYWRVLHVFRLFIAAFPTYTANQTVTTKFIYQRLLNKDLHSPRICGVYPLIDFSLTWKWVNCPFVDAPYRDLSWRIAHNVLPTQSYLYKYGISRISKCYLCGRGVETLQHLFFGCTALHGLWSFVENVFASLTGTNVSIPLQTILFNVFQERTHAVHNELLVLLVNMFKHSIWFKRNQSKFEFLNVNALHIKSLFISTLSLRIKADFHRLDLVSFQKYWGLDNSVLLVNNNSIKILLRLHPP